MKLMVASYNNGGATHNAEVEETQFRTYQIEHEFGEPARCIIKLADPTGAMLQKYNADANDVYLGVGRVTLEDPTGTDLFYGRIEKIIGNTADKTLTLECEDWLVQLDDEQILYDMREKLGTTDLRQSKGRADVDGDRLVVDTDAGTPPYLFYDDGDYDDDGGMGFANDQHNGMLLVFSIGMAGTQTWRFHPFDSTATDHDVYGDDVDAVWVDDNTIDGGFANNDWTLEYHFRVELGHNTPSDFYVHDSITAARIIATWQIPAVAAGNHSHIEVYENSGPSWVELQRLEEGDHRERDTWVVSQTELPDVVDNTGQFNIRFNLDRTGGNLTLTLYHLAVELDVTTTGTSTQYLITDTHAPNLLRVNHNLTLAANQMWEGVPYCIVQTIPYHLDTDLGGTLFSTGDDNVAITATDVELTSGYSTRQFKDKSRLKIIQFLARHDKSVFWMILGGTAIKYVQTFGADTVQIDDGDVVSWTSMYDFRRITNEYRVYGARIGDAEVFQVSSNAASQTKYLATKTKVLKNAGLTTDYDASTLGTALAARDAEHLLPVISATVTGNTATAAHAKTMVLGDIVEITSSKLWSTASNDYVITRWAYDSTENRTYLTLMPKVSIGYQELQTDANLGDRLARNQQDIGTDKVIADPVDREVA